MAKSKNNLIKIFLVEDKKCHHKLINDEALSGYAVSLFESFSQAYYSVYASPPQLLIISFDEYSNYSAGKVRDEEKKQLKMIGDMQLDNMLSNIPILFILPENFDFKRVKNERFFLKDYIKRPFNQNEIEYKIKSMLNASKSALDANPLTKLPGNSSIMESVKTKLDNKTDFSFAYIDIDNFKSYNDKYGFLRGDEVIMMTSRLIATTVYDISKARSRDTEKQVFIGHIGGDDFVVISNPEDMEDIAETIVGNFDKIILSFYDNTDRERGYIEAYGRQKTLNKFPVMSLSVAVIPYANNKITHYGQISEIASGLKKQAKEKSGSNIVIDKRTF